MRKRRARTGVSAEKRLNCTHWPASINRHPSLPLISTVHYVKWVTNMLTPSITCVLLMRQFRVTFTVITSFFPFFFAGGWPLISLQYYKYQWLINNGWRADTFVCFRQKEYADQWRGAAWTHRWTEKKGSQVSHLKQYGSYNSLQKNEEKSEISRLFRYLLSHEIPRRFCCQEHKTPLVSFR